MRQTGKNARKAMGFGKVLILLGVILIVVGALWVLGEKLGLGRLPGDVVYRGERVTVYFPVVTSIVLSVLLTLALWLVQWLRR